MSIHLHEIYGCLTTALELNDCDRIDMINKSNYLLPVYCSFYRKCLLLIYTYEISLLIRQKIFKAIESAAHIFMEHHFYQKTEEKKQKVINRQWQWQETSKLCLWGRNWRETYKGIPQIPLKYVDELCHLFQKSCQKLKVVLQHKTTRQEAFYFNV